MKIFNDPVYGFICFPKDSILLKVVDHPYFQRMRRIAQTGLTYYVYPGAHHTRFHHALGAYHLITQAVEVLRQKNTHITHEEAEGVYLAILLHDIGHGPFSHALEHSIINYNHEALSLYFMQVLNEEFDGKLSLAIEIFTDKYEKKFLHQLVSGQLDMDRLDYLNRDSYFTGVSEGIVGYDRIIKMLNVVNGELVVEEKGIYAVENFLIARRLMYWQVYLHKTVLVSEQMLIKVFKRAKELYIENSEIPVTPALKYFFDGIKPPIIKKNIKELIEYFAKLDDIDIIASLKLWANHNDYILAFLSQSILDRKLLKIKLQSVPFKAEEIEKIKQNTIIKLSISNKLYNKQNEKILDFEYLIFSGTESNRTYNTTKDAIKILAKTGEVKSITEMMDYELHNKNIYKYYLCYPKYL